jgi:IS30 family transposase
VVLVARNVWHHTQAEKIRSNIIKYVTAVNDKPTGVSILQRPQTVGQEHAVGAWIITGLPPNVRDHLVNQRTLMIAKFEFTVQPLFD